MRPPLNGKVAFFNTTKGIGKIMEIGPTGKTTGNEFFVHQSEVKMAGLKTLLPGWEVTFQTAIVGEHPKPQAIEVKVLPGQSLVHHTVPVLSLNNKAMDLTIDSQGRIYVGGIATTVTPSSESKNKELRAYAVNGKPERGFNLAVPDSDSQAAFVLLTHDKKVCATLPGKQYHNVRVGSYFLKLVKVKDNPEQYRVTIWNLGFRQQKDRFGERNWIIIERRFDCVYSSQTSVELQTPVTGMPMRDNDGFVPAIKEALALTCADKLKVALADMLEEAEEVEPAAVEG